MGPAFASREDSRKGGVTLESSSKGIRVAEKEKVPFSSLREGKSKTWEIKGRGEIPVKEKGGSSRKVRKTKKKKVKKDIREEKEKRPCE